MKRWRRAHAILAAALTVAWLTGCSSTTTLAPPTPTALTASTQAQLSQDALDAFARALIDPRATGNTPALQTAIKAGHRLGVRSAQFQYVDSLALSDADLAAFGSRAWAAEVSTTYRLPFDPGPTEMTISMVFAPDASMDSAQIVSIGGYGNRSALWMDRPTSLSIGPRLVVIDARPQTLSYYVKLGKNALQTVANVLPSWQGTLVIEVPTNQDELNQVLQTSDAQLTDIAAVTTTADGTLTTTSPIHVFANPDVFTTMTPLGARVVMSHEATHVATSGPLSTMPTWMLEGFADYVALARANIPVQTAARQILTKLAKNGLPTRLPTSEDLAPTAGGLGATYEEAWLAWRYLGSAYGQDKAVAFYQAVNGGLSAAEAFSRVLGTTEDAFVAHWQDDLRTLVAARP